MTDLKRPVARTSRGLVREAGKPREVVVVLRPPNIIGFRAKGCRKEYQLTTDACYWLAMKADQRAKTREKKKQKKLKKQRRLK